MSGRFHVGLRAPLAVGGGGIEAPSIRLLDAEKVEQYVVLDAGTAAQPIDWETTGLVPAEADRAQAIGARWPATSVYRVVAAQHAALGRLRPTVGRNAQIALSQLESERVGSRRVATTANYVIVPAGERLVEFELPPETRLVQALVDGGPARSSRRGLRTWRVAAPSETLPYELSIVYDAPLPLRGGQPEALAAPRLRQLQSPPGVWMVRQAEGKDGFGVVVTAEENPAIGVRQCSALEAEIVALEGHVKALEAVLAARGSAVPQSVLVESFVRWQHSVEIIRKRLDGIDDRLLLSSELNERRQAAESAVGNIRQRLVQAGLLPEDFFVTPRDVANSRESKPSQDSYLVTAAEAGLPLQPLPSGAEPVFPQWLLGILSGAGILLAMPLARRAAREQWLLAQPALWLAALGLVWWLALPAGWLGWLLTAAAVALACRERWAGWRSLAGGA
jgi:hypothetical protein